MSTQRFDKLKIFASVFLLIVANSMYATSSIDAAVMPNTYIRTSRMAAGTSAKFRLVFKTVAAGATSLTVNFNGADSATWTGSSGAVNATQTVSSASCAAETSTTALPGGALAASGSGSTVTISSITALSATTSYCVDLTSATALTMPVAGEYHPLITVGSDSTTVALRSITNDAIVVTATVPPVFNLALSANADTFTTNLSPLTVAVTGGTPRTVTINTNAKNGWFAYAFDSNTGLNSASAANTIASTTPGSTATLTAGTPGYVFGITSITQGTGGGTTSAVAAYNSNGTTTGSGLDTTIRQIASSTGTANGAQLTVKELAAISATTQPGTDYTDTITIIGAGYF